MFPTPSPPFDVAIEITQFGNLLNFEYLQTTRPLAGEAVATGNAFSGEDLKDTVTTGVIFDTFDGTLVGTTLVGTLQKFRDEGVDLVEYTVVCQSGACLGGGGEEPEPQDFVFWRANGGAFGDAANWEPERMPSGNDTAVFDRVLTDPVTVGTETTRRLQFEQGTVTLSGGTLNLSTSSLTPGLRSLEVGSNGLAVLSLENHSLNTVHALLGANATSLGDVTLIGDAVWNNAGRLSIGFESGGDASFGSGLSILDGASVNSAESRIGDGPGGLGRVVVRTDPETTEQEETSGPSNWDTGNLAVGFEGDGSLDIVNGVVASGEAVVIASEVNSRGEVNVSGKVDGPNWLIDGSLFVGSQGVGTLRAADLAEVLIADDLIVGGGESSCGAVDVVTSTLQLGRLLLVGNRRTQGLVRVLDGGLLDCENGQIGSEQGSEVVVADSTSALTAQNLDLGMPLGEVEPQVLGTLTLRNDGIVHSISVTVNSGSAIQGIGAVTGNVTTNGGILAPGGTGFSIESDCAIEDPEPKRSDAFGAQDPEAKQSDVFGVLEIDGNLSMTGGSVIATIGGSGAGEFSQLVITGNASFIDTTITLSFDDGFSPTTGDEFSAIVVDGTLTTENLRIEIEGADPDFAFDLSEVDGRLMVMTTVGAEPSSGGGCAAARVGAGPGFGLDGFLVALSLTVLFVLRRHRLSSRSRCS